MKVRFWGTRGSIASPGPGTIRFGGNTSCVEVNTASGGLLVLDCGTGAHRLAGQLMTQGKQAIDVHILLGHTHWDHIQGFPFFTPAFVKGNSAAIYGPEGSRGSLHHVLAGQMEFTYFPVELSQLPAVITYHDLTEGIYTIGGVRVATQFLHHPAMTLGYRLEADGVTVVYLVDHEPFSDMLWRADAEPGYIDSILHEGDRRHAKFMAGADLVIHDAQYTPEEFSIKRNFGHSAIDYAVTFARIAGVGRLLLFHHDPARTDDQLDAIVANYRKAPVRYVRWRNTLVLMLAVSIVVFWFYPLMPPRLMPDHFGFVDAAARYFNFGPQVRVHLAPNGQPSAAAVRAYGNLFAAMPSLHVGWSTWSALAVWPLLRRTWAKVLWALYPVSIFFCIVVTANHWILDAVGGWVVLALGYLGALGIEQLLARRNDRSSVTA